MLKQHSSKYSGFFPVAAAPAMAHLELPIDDQHSLFGVDAHLVAASLNAVISALARARIKGLDPAIASSTSHGIAAGPTVCV